MSMFFLIFLFIYAVMHLLLLARVRFLLPPGWLVRWLVFVLGLFLLLAPFTGRILERKGFDAMALTVSAIGYVWMGFILISLAPCLIVTVYQGVALVLRRFTARSWPLFPDKPAAIGILLFSVGMSVYGLYEASVIRVETVVISTDKLPQTIDRFRVVQISDLHLGLTTRDKTVIKLIDQLKGLNPDVLVSTGDMIDGKRRHAEELALLFSGLVPRWGKYAILGNHEYYRGIAKSQMLLENAGFQVLRGESVSLGGAIALIGVDDDSLGASSKLPKHFQVDQSLFTILLKHRPEVDDDLPFRLDLQLSGHSHGGQIFPFTIPVALRYEYHRGFNKLAGGGAIYTNRGTGVWGPPMRVFSPPEITVIELVQAHHKN